MNWKNVIKRLQVMGLSFRTWEEHDCPPTGTVRGEKIIAESVPERGKEGQSWRAFIYVTKKGTIGIRAGEQSTTHVHTSVESALDEIKEKNIGRYA